MANKAPMKDMVIILPGILGSVLQKDGKDLWAVSGQAIWQVLTQSGETIHNLKLSQDDPEAESLGDGIRATELIHDTHLIPGFWKIDGYTKTARLITDNFDVTPGDIYNDPDDRAANFYQFPYDWRRDNRANAHILKKLIDKRLKCWRETSGASDAKVILMAHSMGGLVSRYYLEVLEGWQDSRALFTFGTPYRGSLKAVNFLANGYKQLFLDLTDVMRSLTSIYQLLPIYKVININGEYHRIAEVDNLPNINKLKAQDALAFHREIEAAVERHLKDEQYLKSFTVVPISGTQQPTLQSAVLTNGTLTATEDLPAILKDRSDLGDGDGTVPKVSSIPIERSQNLDNFFIAEQHGALQNQAQVLDNLLNVLRMGTIDLEAIKGETQAAISLSLEDLYLADEPIAMRARLIGLPNSATKLKADIQAVSGVGFASPTGNRPAISLDFVEQENEWVLAIEDLPPGLYRVRVRTDSSEQAPSPVHDLFEVVRN
ncbi:MAG: lecithin--cholesterol acyltransferase [Drouetiella hepatica Uher 2000/2452]|jgi:triacylglycerol esterase/lipase EstA (alpha/beta hydrolase family)|uniref:Lecithin--cholesterol acyltransferase n=1 Tax=Drouetiella hepatica Uher 2000/2452 TaxID=904376 RepID=A0A951QDH6_9CYAN|nr:lecithin--cholesterol acyltransferase [Drouetiella hepatica Uher 2000/2452]